MDAQGINDLVKRQREAFLSEFPISAEMREDRLDRGLGEKNLKLSG